MIWTAYVSLIWSQNKIQGCFSFFSFFLFELVVTSDTNTYALKRRKTKNLMTSMNWLIKHYGNILEILVLWRTLWIQESYQMASIDITLCNECEQRSSAYYTINHNRCHYHNGKYVMATFQNSAHLFNIPKASITFISWTITSQVASLSALIFYAVG